MVHVKKVEIFGFKSFGFANTTVQFEPGLVSISGPNGSGKSNILDAIIFALGENRPKMMRVDKLRSLMHDVERSRRGPRMARSSVHFDNSDRRIPVDSNSVEITREMDAGGENTYYLNKKKTNRGHILDLLDMANAGLGQLNAVQQGTVTRISEFTSEEKRKAIEDLIGLSYFDEKKTEAAKQLDEADRRLEIALAKMGEIKKRIDELEEERNQKMRSDLIGRELDRYRAVAAADKIKAVSARRADVESRLDSVASEIARLKERRGALQGDEDELGARKAELMGAADDYAKSKAALDAQISAAMEQYEVHNSAISASRKRMGQIDGRIPAIAADLEQAALERDRTGAKISEAKGLLDEIDARKEKIGGELGAADSRRAKVLAEQSEAAARQSETDDRVRQLRERLNAEELSLSKMRHEKGEADSRARAGTARLEEMGRDIATLSAHRARLQAMMDRHAASIAARKSKADGLNAKKAAAARDMEDLGLVLEKSSRAATQYESKIKAVKTLMHEDYSVAMLKEDRAAGGERKGGAAGLGIEGLVYEMISWDRRYERPVLAAGGDWIKAVVVRDFATLLGLAEEARERNLPKLRIIPLDAIPELRSAAPGRGGPDVLGPLSDYVRCAPEHAGLRAFLFGGTVLTRTRGAAHAASRSGYRAVTLAGEFFEADGGAVVVDINSKISKITRLISMGGDIDGLFKSIGMIRRYMHKRKQAVRRIDASVQSLSERISLSEKALASARENHSNLESRIESATSARGLLAERMSGLAAEAPGRASRIEACRSRIESLRGQVREAEKEYGGGDQARIARMLSEVNTEKARLERERTAAVREHSDASSRIASLQAHDGEEESRAGRLREEEASLRQEYGELGERIAGLERQKESGNDALVGLRQKEQDLIAMSGSSIGKLKEYDDRLRAVSADREGVSGKINALVRQSDSLGRDLKDMKEEEARLGQVISAFGLDPGAETFDAEPVIAGLAAEAGSLDALNARAPETYLEISSGYRSMSARKNSLEEERNSIVRFIEEIDKDKRQTFLDAFDGVDKEIRLIFNKMTGGNAWLELQNEDDIFGSGISYLIQFPNKPKRESTSISGGEKTLAAIVFVLALQRLKPSPFYLFDEVDAHLDAPNAKRLASILEERSKESQFIMVSLKDSVVQKARLIYGVFPKNGVSHVVTYKDRRVPPVRASS